jgi:cytochrome c oxidase subunit II
MKKAKKNSLAHALKLILGLFPFVFSLSAFAALPADIVKDMQGGPKVRQMNFAEPVTEIAKQIDFLHIMVMAICLFIFLAVFGVMFYSIFKHRKSKGAKSANFHESITVEIVWTVIPFIIVILMALPATKTVVAMKDTSNADMTIKATGYQWKWGYTYVKGEGEGINFLSTLSTPREQINNLAPKSNTYLMEVDNPLVVPVNKKVRVITTAQDVIHAWMVPAFGVKQDAIPGLVRDTWFKADKVGTFRGQCAELCGKEHAFMPIVVEVKSAEDYAAWVKIKQKEMLAKADDPTKTYTLDELHLRGEKVYGANCAVCHQANGGGGGGIPALDQSKIVNGSFAGQMEILLKGKNGMPSWSSLSDTDLASVMTYTRNNWSNKTGELIQPMDFVNARAGNYKAGGGNPNAKTVETDHSKHNHAAASSVAPAPSDGGGNNSAVDNAIINAVYFASGKFALTKQDEQSLEKLAMHLVEKSSKAKIILSGYVDSTGSAQKNQEIAKKRAMAVKDILIAKGISESNIILEKPQNIQSNTDAKQARRVEITIQ